jgi:hypothetical protein
MSYGFIILLCITVFILHVISLVFYSRKFGSKTSEKGFGDRLPTGGFFRRYWLYLFGFSCLLCAAGCLRQPDDAPSAGVQKCAVPQLVQQNQECAYDYKEHTSRAKKMAIEGHIKPAGRRMYGLRSKHEKASKNGLWPLPQNIAKELNQVDLYYVESVMQPEDSGTCGSRCIANALGISDTLEQGDISARAIYEQSLTYDYLHKRNNMSNSVVAKMAASMHLDHVHTLGYYEYDCFNSNQLKKNPFTCTGSTKYGFSVNLYEEETIQQKIIRTIRNIPDTIVHFICALQPITNYDSGHWVLISIIKRHDQKPAMIYMDSCNIPLEQEPQSQAYLSYLYWQCIA